MKHHRLSVFVCLLLMLGLGLTEIFDETRAQAAPSTLFVPSEIRLLVVSASGNEKAGNILMDLATYGFNTTWHGVTSGTDYTTDPTTSNINQYDVVILQDTQDGQPTQVTEKEVEHFTNTFKGVLIHTHRALFLNETSGRLWGWTSNTMAKIERRLGVDFTGWAPISMQNGTFHRKSSLINGLEYFMPFKVARSLTTPNINLNGATQLYNFTNDGGGGGIGITYYRNTTGTVGIHIAGFYSHYGEPQTDVPYHLGLYGGKYQDVNADYLQKRSRFMAQLIAYALDKDFDMKIRFQPMAIFRVDDYIMDGMSDQAENTSLAYLYQFGNSRNVPVSMAIPLIDAANRPTVIQSLIDLELSSKGWGLESHMRHIDYRTYTIAQLESLIETQFNDFRAHNFEKFTSIIAPSGYYSNNLFTAMSNKGVYLVDVGAGSPPIDWDDISVNNTVIVKGGKQPAGVNARTENFTEVGKDRIHMESYVRLKSRFAQAIFNSAPTIYVHRHNFLRNEVGTWAFKTFYDNMTSQIPDVEFVSNELFCQYFGKKWAKMSSASRSGSTVTFTVNTDDTPNVVTIGKGMLWLRIDAGNTIKEVKINGSNWYVFDDHTIRIPAENSQIQVTLGTPSTPYIKNSNRKITASSYDSDKLTFTVDSLSGTVSRTKVYAGNKGEPARILGARSYSFNVSSNILTIIASHSSPATITVDWTTGIPNTPPVASALAITPSTPHTADDLVGSYTYFDAEGDLEFGTEVRWYKDNVLQPLYDDTLIVSSSSTEIGEVWHFTVRPKDGKDFGTLQTSPTVTIRGLPNTPPVAGALIIAPSLPYTTDDLVGSYAYNDADGDPEFGTEIRWYKDSILQSIYNDTLIVLSSSTEPGQEWYFTVRPKDGKDFGVLQTSPSVTILNTASYIFFDGFETGDFSMWDGTAIGGSDSVYVASESSHDGAFSAKSVIIGKGHAYFQKSFTSQATIYVQWYIKFAADMPDAPGEQVWLSVLLGANGVTEICRVGVSYYDGGARITLYNVGGSTYYGLTLLSPNTWYSLEYRFGKSSNGDYKVWMNGSQEISVNLNLSGKPDANQVRIGVARYTELSPTVYTDSVVVDDSYIAP